MTKDEYLVAAVVSEKAYRKAKLLRDASVRDAKHSGATLREIAKIVDLSPSTIHVICRGRSR